MDVVYLIKYQRKVEWKYPPETVFRSVLGMNLHRTCCVVKDQKSCKECFVRGTCVYSWMFETHIEKNNEAITGRDHAPHPFLMEYSQVDEVTAEVLIRFLGKARSYIPFISAALIKAGENGVSNERVPFSIDRITCNGLEFDYSVEATQAASHRWSLSDTRKADEIVGIKFITPCRIKSGGKYLGRILLQDVIKSSLMRISILENLYGEPFEVQEVTVLPISIDQNQKWIDRRYYSKRSNTSMLLGGVVGDILIKGPLDDFSANILKAAEVFHIGKNVAFGLGKIELQYREK